jgi:hypothetical protein
VDYDEDVDVLYLGQRGIADGETPEGASWLYPDDQSDDVVGLIVIDASRVTSVTLPDGTKAPIAGLKRP